MQLLVGPLYGVSWLDQFSCLQEPPRPRPDARPGLDEGLLPPSTLLGPGEHPFPTRYAAHRMQLRIEPSIYLEALVRDFTRMGGRVVIRRFDTQQDLQSLAEPVLVNCTGLGSKDLFGDDDMVPLKGQLVLLVPQPEITYYQSGGLLPTPPDSVGTHMMPRSDGIALGGVSLRGVWNLEVDEAERTRVMDGHMAFFAAMAAGKRA